MTDSPESDALREAVRTRELLRALDPAAAFHAGSAEPWIAQLVAALAVACDARVAIEVGGFEGYTSAHIAQALARLPHVTEFTVCEIDLARANAVQAALASVAPSVHTRVVVEDSHAWLPTLAPDSVDFAWIDGNHEQAHVAREIELLWPKLRVGGIAAFHDVYGVCDLQRVVRAAGGYALDLPKLGPAGGLGLLQRRE